MKVNDYILAVILGSAIVTFLPRVLPLVLLSRMNLPESVTRYLSYVPIAVIAALIGQEIFIDDGSISMLNNFAFIAAIPTFIIAVFTRNLLATVITGIMSMMFIRYFL